MEQQDQLQLKIRALEKEIARLHTQIKQQRYGLTWLDVPEAFDNDAETKIPILEEAKDKAIAVSDCGDGVHTVSTKQPTPPHIIIEGDNYHALTCLNYTHKGKIDVIYIDPPYNTGSDGFTYKDKRVLTQYPDGTPVPREHPLRHSIWLSFMSKRLTLAKNLLSDKGVIFISIDDNEQANLKLLCDKVFGEENFVAVFPRITKKAGKTTNVVANNNDYVLTYSKSRNIKFNTLEHSDKEYKHSDEYESERGKYKLSQTLDYGSIQYSKTLDYEISINDKTFRPGNVSLEEMEARKIRNPQSDYCWRWSKDLFEFGLANGFIVVKTSRNGSRIYTKTYQNATIERNSNGYKVISSERTKLASTLDLIENEFSNDNAKKDLDKIFNQKVFDYSKPISLIERLTFLSSQKSSTILDFFAGSGTTLHATLKLNAEDGGTRQCILVQQKEGENNICENVTYERNRRVMCGYTNAKGEQVAGLGGSLKYYRTAFVGKHTGKDATDEDRVLLSQKAGYLLALSENTLEEIEKTDCYQLFGDGGKQYTAIYFVEDLSAFDVFVDKIAEIQTDTQAKIAVYIFSFGQVDDFRNDFDNLNGITIKSIPDPILNIYKAINEQ